MTLFGEVFSLNSLSNSIVSVSILDGLFELALCPSRALSLAFGADAETTETEGQVRSMDTVKNKWRKPWFYVFKRHTFPAILKSEKLTIEYVESVTLPGTKQATSKYLQAWGDLQKATLAEGISSSDFAVISSSSVTLKPQPFFGTRSTSYKKLNSLLVSLQRYFNQKS